MHENRLYRSFKARSPGKRKALPIFIIITALLFFFSLNIVFADEPTSTAIADETTLTESVDQFTNLNASTSTSETDSEIPSNNSESRSQKPLPVLTNSTSESSPLTPSGGKTFKCELQGWDITPHEKWSPGEISGYYENEYIPYRLTLSGVPKNSTISITVFYDKLKDSIYGVDHLITTGSYKPINSSYPPFTFGVSGASSWSAITNPDSPGSGGVTQGSVTWTINTGSNNEVIIMFGAHLAIGSHLWNGASLHVNLKYGCGSQDVPIKVNEILFHQLSIDKKVSTGLDYDDIAVVHEGDNVTFKITARDDGNLFNDQTSATIVDTLPSGLSYVSGSANVAPSSVVVNPDGSTTITWNITLLEKTDFVITFDATVTSSAPSFCENTATLIVSGTDPISDTASVKVLRPDIEITKSATPTVIHAGEEVTYSFTVENTGDTTLYEIVVTDSILGLIGTIESLAPGEKATLEKKVKVYEDTTNVATATGYDELEKEVGDESNEVFVDVLGLSYVSGFVFLDANLNGIFDPGEAPIPGITIFLFKDGTLVASTVTKSDGSYKFDNLEPGTYMVSIDLPLEYELTTASSVALSIDEENPGRADFGLTPAPVLPFTPELPPVLPYTGPNTIWYFKLALSLMLSLFGILLITISRKLNRKI